jgi:hypothetical protein
MTATALARSRFTDSGAFWFVASAACSLAGPWLARRAFTQAPPSVDALVLVPGLVLTLGAGLAAWRLAHAGRYAWMLPLAALGLLLLQPGRAGDPRTWRLEWGVMGLGWALAAVLVFARLLRRSDELEQRLHLEGASIGLALGLVAAVVYSLFEPRLPELRAQWVAVALLAGWWAGFLLSAARYRVHA